MATAPKNKKDKADYGTGRTPGHFCVIPQRAVADIRFKTYPRTFMVLCALGNYTSRQGVCWPNQVTIAKVLGIKSQSTVSKHIKKLIDMGYIKYAKKHPGLKGNKYFMVFDPDVSEEDAAATATVDDRSYEEKPEIPKGPKMGTNTKYSLRRNTKTKDKDAVKEGDKVDIHSKEYVDIHSEGMHNNKLNNDIFLKGKYVMNEFKKLTEQIFGQNLNYNMKQLEIVQSWIADKGLDPDKAVKKIKDILIWRRDNRKDSPKSIVFFEHAFFKRPPPVDKAEEIQRMIKKISNARRLR
jgi:hypothetical protein